MIPIAFQLPNGIMLIPNSSKHITVKKNIFYSYNFRRDRKMEIGKISADSVPHIIQNGVDNFHKYVEEEVWIGRKMGIT